MSWCLTSDAQPILAVAIDHTVQIYARQRLKEIQNDQSWALCDEMKLDGKITAITWAEPGVLVTASGQTLVTYSKWLTMEDKVPGK